MTDVVDSGRCLRMRWGLGAIGVYSGHSRKQGWSGFSKPDLSQHSRNAPGSWIPHPSPRGEAFWFSGGELVGIPVNLLTFPTRNVSQSNNDIKNKAFKH